MAYFTSKKRNVAASNTYSLVSLNDEPNQHVRKTKKLKLDFTIKMCS